MQLSSILALLIPFCALTNAYSCASWVPPEECVKSAAAFSQRMKTATFSMPKLAATAMVDISPGGGSPSPSSPTPPPKHRNCGTLAMMDATDAACDRMYRPQAAQPSPVPRAEAESPLTTLATAIKRTAPSQA